MAFRDRKTPITGIGASRFERRPEAWVLDFAGEALNAALADAGLDKEQIDGLVVQVGSPRGADYDTIALTFGLSPFYCGQTWAHGRFAASVIIQAAMAVSAGLARSEEHTSEIQSLIRTPDAVFCLKQKKTNVIQSINN